MLVKDTLQKSIEVAIYEAMKTAFIESLKAVENTNDKTNVSKDVIANAFASKAKECSNGIADAIDSYIKSAQIVLPIGTILTPAPTLVSPVGPVTGIITLAAPTLPITNAIS